MQSLLAITSANMHVDLACPDDVNPLVACRLIEHVVGVDEYMY